MVRLERQVSKLETECTTLHSIINSVSPSVIQAILAANQAEEDDQSGLPDLNEPVQDSLQWSLQAQLKTMMQVHLAHPGVALRVGLWIWDMLLP